MNLKELRKLVERGETDQVEFKKSTGQRTSAAKTVCAMLNGLGGFVIFGVLDSGQIIGQQTSNRTLEDIASELRRIEPPVFPDMKTVRIDAGKSVLILNVSGGGGPFTFDGRPYLRNGPTTSVMPRAEYEKRLIEHLHATRRWENEPVPAGVSVHDLDEEEIQITFENAVRLGRLEPTGYRDTESILRGLELFRDDHLLNAAVSLYGKSDRLKTIFPQMGIRLARFRGKDRLADFTDNRQYWGHAFSLLRKAESFLMDHVPIAGRVVSGKMIREDQPWYPPRATREALANALCHRDYTIPGGAVAVAMYDDHLEVTNPGAFQFGITPEKLTKPHESKPWNPIIANVFYRAGIIERWGTGTLNIIDWCAENNNPSPAWSEQSGSVYVVFKPAVLPDVSGRGTQVTAQVDDEHKINKIKTLERVIDKLPGLSAQVTAQVTIQVLDFCKEPRKASEIMELLGLKHWRTFQKNYLNPMLETEIIERTIPDKPRSSKQKYRLSGKGKELLNITGKSFHEK